jgi:hypothetical protein
VAAAALIPAPVRATGDLEPEPSDHGEQPRPRRSREPALT